MQTLVCLSLVVVVSCGSGDDPARYAKEQARPSGSRVRSFGPDPASAPQKADVEELVYLLIGPARKPYLAVRQLERSRPLLTPAELAIVDRIVARIHPNGEIDEIEDVLRDLGRLAPDDVGAQAAVMSTLQGTPEPYQGELETPAHLQQWVVDARALVKRFPNKARAHGVLGNALVGVRGATFEALTELKTCLELDPSQEKCRERYNELAEFHTARRCTPPAMRRSLALYRADVGAGVSGRAVTWEGKKLSLRKPPLVTRRGFRQARAQHEGVRLELSGEAVETLAPLYDLDSAVFALVVDDRVLLADDLAEIYGPLRFLLLPPDVSLDTLCKSSVSRPLPDGFPSRVD